MGTLTLGYNVNDRLVHCQMVTMPDGILTGGYGVIQ